ncbi:hypothetical protein M4I32_09390 [Microbacterium sp. LRZ72]|uniref:hypothetical protein n=1 Tax=Microbacterium sp. LRZ72 TaxID=2942481 RepID=UPI0029AC2F18|nr:hypothetical protein [Microbacterium sp. LRZ72]MDX2377010.1 hypothetical protein [Microbacterium sp. LRZ72]
MLKKAVALRLAVGSLAVGIIALGAPAAASADTVDAYAQPASVTVEPAVIEPCMESTIVFGERYWGASESVAFGATGFRAEGATIVSPVNANADGSLVATFQPASDAAGVYEVTFVAESGSYTAMVTVTEAGPACDADPNVLAFTGSELGPWTVFAGAGLVVAGGAALMMRARSKRS